MDSSAHGIQIEDIQAHIIRSARPAAARYYFLSISNPALFARFLKSDAFCQYLLSEKKVRDLKDGKSNSANSPFFANIGFTHSGLARMGIPSSVLGQFPLTLQEGMAERAAHIGDQGRDDPVLWETFFGSQNLNVLITLNFMPWLSPCFKVPTFWAEDDQQAHLDNIEACWNDLIGNDVSSIGAISLMTESAHVIRHKKRVTEHFGFVDGISQPYIQDQKTPISKGGGKKTHQGADWQALAAGEFLLGYYDELGIKNLKAQGRDPESPLLPASGDPLEQSYQNLTLNGSFLVYRKLEQNVKLFRSMSEERGHGLTQKMMGRQYNGNSLKKEKGEYASECSHQSAKEQNDFDYSDDISGNICPYASHARRANPRLTLTGEVSLGTEMVDQHRIIRRALAYGPFVEPNVVADDISDAKRGLHFMCYNARVDSQFEFIQKNWMNNSDFLRLSSKVVDPIVGNRENKSLGQFSLNEQALPVFGLPQFVTVKGGEYFFTPGLKGISRIAQTALSSIAAVSNGVSLGMDTRKPFNPEETNPEDAADFLNPQTLMLGARFEKFIVSHGDGVSTPYYYFAHPEEVKKILSVPEVFTVDLYRKRIVNLTGADMLLSSPPSDSRINRKELMRSILKSENFIKEIKAVLKPALKEIKENIEKAPFDLVEDVARKLPLAIIKGYYGIEPVESTTGPVSPFQIAHYFGRVQFDALPLIWKKNYGDYGFSATGDDTLLFWVRMLFLEVFGNMSNTREITEMATMAAMEFLPQLDRQVTEKMSGSADDTIMSRLICGLRETTDLTHEEILVAVRQHVLELAVGSTDTTMKGIVAVVDKLLSMGLDIQSGLMTVMQQCHIPADRIQQCLKSASDQSNTVNSQIEEDLNTAIRFCLNLEPVAPILVRFCKDGARYTLGTGQTIEIEAGAIVCLPLKLTTNSLLQQGINTDDFIFVQDTAHGCMGREIALLEIRETLKLLLQFKSVRPAAGERGKLQTKLRLPSEMILRYDR